MKLLLAAFLMAAASLTGAQEVNEPGELPTLEEIDRQLNIPLSKTWALTLQDNIGIQEGDLVEGSTWNITKEGVRTGVAVMNSQPYPSPSVVERQQEAPGGEKYETPEWILQGFAWETMPVMDEVFEEFNQEFGTDFEFQLKAMEPKDK